LNLLQELSEVYSDEEREQNFLRILGNLSGVMSDWARVTKKYKVELNDVIKTTLGTQENIQFLYCNVHFLLGLGSTSDKTLKGVQAELKEDRIGRPEPTFSAVFSDWGSSCLLNLYGVWGAGSQGRWKEWMPGCLVGLLPHKQSDITCDKLQGQSIQQSFWSSFYRQHIVEFFAIYMADRNQKLESVLNDPEWFCCSVCPCLGTDVPQGERVILETPWVQDPLLGLLLACCWAASPAWGMDNRCQ